MSNNNNSGNFFKFKNVQLVRRPNSARQTGQNTDIRMQGTAEEQFAGIAVAALYAIISFCLLPNFHQIHFSIKGFSPPSETISVHIFES